MDLRHVGHVEFTINHSSTHSLWKWCAHGNSRKDCAASYVFKQIQQQASSGGNMFVVYDLVSN